MELKENDQLRPGQVIAKEIALTELSEVVDYYTREKLTNDELADRYPRTLAAIENGLLEFDNDKVPTYTLEKPLNNTDGDVFLDKIVFKTRLTLSDRKRLTAGLNPEKDIVEMGYRNIAYSINQPVVMVDKFDRWDQKVISELVGLFQ